MIITYILMYKRLLSYLYLSLYIYLSSLKLLLNESRCITVTTLVLILYRVKLKISFTLSAFQLSQIAADDVAKGQGGLILVVLVCFCSLFVMCLLTSLTKFGHICEHGLCLSFFYHTTNAFYTPVTDSKCIMESPLDGHRVSGRFFVLKSDQTSWLNSLYI